MKKNDVNLVVFENTNYLLLEERKNNKDLNNKLLWLSTNGHLTYSD